MAQTWPQQTNIFGQLIASEHGFSIAAYERRQLGFLVVVVKASAQWSRFENEFPLAEKTEAALQIEQTVGKWAGIE